MSDITAVLEKKLKQSIDIRKSLETARHKQVEALCSLTAKLSLACKGQDISLDTQLAKFRSTLNSGVDFDKLHPFIEATSTILTTIESVNNKNEHHLKQTIEDAGRQLQKVKGMPSETRRKLRYFLEHELNEIKSTIKYIPAIDMLVSIYNSVLSAKSIEIEPDTTNENIILNTQIYKELLHVSEQLTLDNDMTEQVNAITAELQEESGLQTLLESALDILKVVADNIKRERESAQGFLLSLNQTIENLNTSITKTTKDSKIVNHRVNALNALIEKKIQLLNSHTNDASTISELKSLLDGELKELNKDIIKRNQLEKADKDALYASFKSVQSKIEHLENTVKSYKKQLTEQRFENAQDSLTELPNRAAFDDKLTSEFNYFRANQSDITLVVIDIDHFKSINDNYGHSAGDKTLKVISKALKKSIRQTDFIARYGGEEFVLLMPGMKLSNANYALDKIRKTIKSVPFKFKNQQVRITISLGATQFKQGDTPLAAFNRADEALYEAKNNGRDRLCLRE